MSGTLTLGRWIRDRARTSPDRVAIDFFVVNLANPPSAVM